MVPYDYCNHGGRLYDGIGLAFESLHFREECVAADVLDAWYPPAPEVVDGLGNELSWLLRTSPPCRADGIKDMLSRFVGVPQKSIAVGAGSSDLIFRALAMCFQKHDAEESARVGVLSPSYGEYAHVLTKLCHAHVHRIYSDESFEFSVDALVEEVKEKQLAGLCLVNPCNPTGRFFSRAQVKDLLSRIPPTCIVCIDETYIEYVGREHSVAKYASEYDNVIVIESLSKTFALSGARVGFLVASPRLVQSLEAGIPTYHISSVATLALRLSLENVGYYRDKIKETHHLREDFRRALTKVSVFDDVLPSHINAVLVKTKAGIAEALRRRLAELRVFVRNIDDQGLQSEFYGRFLRISVLSREDNARILKAVSRCVSS